MLKKYFILCGIEQSFPKFSCFLFEKTWTKSQRNCRYSKKIDKPNFLIKKTHKREAILHWLEQRGHFLYSYVVYHVNLRKYIDLFLYCLFEKWLTFYSWQGHLEGLCVMPNNNYDTIWGYMEEYWKLNLNSFQ